MVKLHRFDVIAVNESNPLIEAGTMLQHLLHIVLVLSPLLKICTIGLLLCVEELAHFGVNSNLTMLDNFTIDILIDTRL